MLNFAVLFNQLSAIFLTYWESFIAVIAKPGQTSASCGNILENADSRALSLKILIQWVLSNVWESAAHQPYFDTSNDKFD